MPTVSVIIPAYDAAAYIGDALDSVFRQTFDDYEVIVVNDGSPDTEELERALEPYRDRIRYIEQENRGPGGARNTGIRAADGPYVAFLDSDDIWVNDHLASQVELLEGEDAPDLVYGNVKLFGDSPLAGETGMERHPSEGPATFRALLRGDCTVAATTVVARKSALVEAGLFDESFRLSEDFDLWLRVAHSGGRIDYQKRVLAYHRKHRSSLTVAAGRLQEQQLGVLQKLYDELSLSREEAALLRRRTHRQQAKLSLVRAKAHLRNGSVSAARREFRKARLAVPPAKYAMIRIGLLVAPGFMQRWMQDLERSEHRGGKRAAPPVPATDAHGRGGS